MSDKWSRLFPQATKNDVTFFRDGRAYYSSLVAEIEAANSKQHYVYILGWMLDDDFELVPGRANTRLFTLLQAAASRDVEIRILIWDSLDLDYAARFDKARLRLHKLPLMAAFADRSTYFPSTRLDVLLKVVIPALSTLAAQLPFPIGFLFDRYARTGRNPGAHHEKVVIVKNANGLIAYCGGMDINPNRLQSTIGLPTGTMSYPVPTVHDLTCRVDGPAAWEVLQRFERRWTNNPDTHGVGLRGGAGNEQKPAPKPGAVPSVAVVGTYNWPDGGGTPDRSGRDAYLRIIANAETYIYIEDQYFVNLDVAKALNKKIKEPRFQRLMLATQDAQATDDLVIPTRKRTDFMNAVYAGAGKSERDKVLLAVIDRSRWVVDGYHPGMHAKTLIVDDQVALIGTMNVNQRSFTNDSETALVVFEDGANVKGNFAVRVRADTWKEFLRRPGPAGVCESPFWYPQQIAAKNDVSILIQYDLQNDPTPDLDKRVSAEINKLSVAAVDVLGYSSLITVAAVAISAVDVPGLFDSLWENAIDPKVD